MVGQKASSKLDYRASQQGGRRIWCWRKWLTSRVGIGRLAPLCFSKGWCWKWKPPLSPFLPINMTALHGLLLQVEILKWRKRKGWLDWRWKVCVMIVLMVSGFGGCLLSPKSNASYGNATIKASLLAPCLLPGEWKFQPFVSFVTQVLKQSYMF